VTRGRTAVIVLAFAAFCLALGYWWSVQLGLPLNGQKPWWYGKDAHVRIQVTEEGHDMATVSMRLPKGIMDTMVALGTDAKISVDKDNTVIGFTSHKSSREIKLRDIWKDLQRLPKGEKLTVKEDGATLTMWIEA
jgi:ribosomal protein L24E